MSKLTKLIILILLSLSVYFIYNYTNNTTIKILTLGDSLSLGKDSLGAKNYGYMNIYRDYLISKNKKVELIDKYLKEDLSIKELLQEVKTNSSLKRDLLESHQLFINVGYNDLIYKISLEEDLKQSSFNKINKDISREFNNLIKEIRKYYKNNIVVIGYFESNKDDYYINKGIRNLNNIYKNNTEIYYIDTYNILKNRKKYFSNPDSYYPNINGYQCIANKIINETLAK